MNLRITQIRRTDGELELEIRLVDKSSAWESIEPMPHPDNLFKFIERKVNEGLRKLNA